MLVMGLPDEAVTWSRHGFSRVEDMVATLVEQQDRWSMAIFQALRGNKRIAVPGVVTFQQPGDIEPPRAKVEQDPRAIAAWFHKHVRG